MRFKFLVCNTSIGAVVTVIAGFWHCICDKAALNVIQCFFNPRIIFSITVTRIANSFLYRTSFGFLIHTNSSRKSLKKRTFIFAHSIIN